jgi:hypothetical protein
MTHAARLWTYDKLSFINYLLVRDIMQDIVTIEYYISDYSTGLIPTGEKLL